MEPTNLRHLSKLAKHAGFIVLFDDIKAWRDAALNDLRHATDGNTETQLNMLRRYRERDDLVRLIDFSLQRAQTELEEQKNAGTDDDYNSSN